MAHQSFVRIAKLSFDPGQVPACLYHNQALSRRAWYRKTTLRASNPCKNRPCISRDLCLFRINTAESVTLGIAVLRAVTGTIATALSVWCVYRHIDCDQIKIRVVSSLGIPTGHAHSPRILRVQVTNLSGFPRFSNLHHASRRSAARYQPHCQLSGCHNSRRRAN